MRSVRKWSIFGFKWRVYGHEWQSFFDRNHTTRADMYPSGCQSHWCMSARCHYYWWCVWVGVVLEETRALMGATRLASGKQASIISSSGLISKTMWHVYVRRCWDGISWYLALGHVTCLPPISNLLVWKNSTYQSQWDTHKVTVSRRVLREETIKVMLNPKLE